MTDTLLDKITNQKILPDSTIFAEIHALKADNDRLVMELNSAFRDPAEVNARLAEITGKIVDQPIMSHCRFTRISANIFT